MAHEEEMERRRQYEQEMEQLAQSGADPMTILMKIDAECRRQVEYEREHVFKDLTITLPVPDKKAFSLKKVVSKGIIEEFEGEVSKSKYYPDNLIRLTSSGRWEYFRPDEYAYTLEEALEKAELLIKKRLASLRKQVEKLESAQIQVKRLEQN